jgi:GDPmannose 4,6-dehydratase
MTIALITGVAGQDGSYLAEFLLGKGYEVHGVVRPGGGQTWRLDELPAATRQRLVLHPLDLLDQEAVRGLVERLRPDELYHLACRGNVPASLADPGLACSEDVLIFHRLLEVVRRVQAGGGRPIRFCQPGSADMFGSAPAPQNERTPFHPLSPFAASKTYCHYLAQSYRAAYGLFVSNAILFNHTSPRCGAGFLTRKVTLAAARIKLGRQQELALGNLEVWRDWGFAGDHVEAMWAMLQQPAPDDFVVGTAQSHSVRELLDTAFGAAGLDWHAHVRVEPALLRPADVGQLWADTTKLLMATGWRARQDFAGLIGGMVRADLDRLARADAVPGTDAELH